jgi:hypothetical protein
MSLPTVFLSYNPHVDTEEMLAVRLFTLGGVSGFEMQLPDRGASATQVTRETAHRIAMADYFVLFSTSALSPVVREEIQLAYDTFRDPSRIIIIYDKKTGKNGLSPSLCTEVSIDLAADAQTIVAQIADKVGTTQKKGSHNFFIDLGGLLLAGLGLFKLAYVYSKSKLYTQREGRLSMAGESEVSYGRPRKKDMITDSGAGKKRSRVKGAAKKAPGRKSGKKG